MTPASTTVSVPTGTWSVDVAHSNVEFRVKHLGISTVRGAFRDFEGTLEIGDDISTAKAYGKINAASIDTNEPLDEDTFEVTGDLTMHGVTKPITLTVETTGVEQQDPWGNERVGLEALGKLDRSEWDMRFNQALGSGNMMVSDKVTISLDISAVKQA